MPNQNSHAHHTPIRTCVVCRAKNAQSEMLGFFLLPEGIVVDMHHRIMKRRLYLCRNTECYAGLAKWKKRQTRKPRDKK